MNTEGEPLKMWVWLVVSAEVDGNEMELSIHLDFLSVCMTSIPP